MGSQTSLTTDEQTQRIERLEAAVRSLLSHANFTSRSLLFVARGSPLPEIEYINPEVVQEFGVAHESLPL